MTKIWNLSQILFCFQYKQNSSDSIYVNLSQFQKETNIWIEIKMDKKKLKQPSISSIFSKKSIQPEPTVDSDSEVDGHGHGPDWSLDENVGEGEGSSARVDRDITDSDTGAGGDSDYTGGGGSGDELGEESQEISGGGSGVFGELGEESQTQETIDDDMVEVVEMDMEGNRKRQSVDMEGNRKRKSECWRRSGKVKIISVQFSFF